MAADELQFLVLFQKAGDGDDVRGGTVVDQLQDGLGDQDDGVSRKKSSLLISEKTWLT